MRFQQSIRFENYGNEILRKYPNIKKIICSGYIASILDIHGCEKDGYKELPVFSTVKINGVPYHKWDKCTFENIELYNDMTFSSLDEEITFLDENDNEIFKTNLDIFNTEYTNQTRFEKLKDILGN